MAPVTAKIFRNGRNQAVRIPVEFSFDTDTVEIEKRGDELVIRPKPVAGWKEFFADPSLRVPEDFDTGDDAEPPEGPEF